MKYETLAPKISLSYRDNVSVFRAFYSSSMHHLNDSLFTNDCIICMCMR